MSRQSHPFLPLVALLPSALLWAPLPAGAAAPAHAAAAAAPRSSAGAATVTHLTVPTTANSTTASSAATRSAPGAIRTVAERSAVATKRFGMVAVTWATRSGADVSAVSIRTRSKGVWTAWRKVDVDDGSEPGQTRLGTEPLWVGSADGVAARVTADGAAVPRAVRVELIDPGASPAGAESSYRTATGARAASSSVAVDDGSPSFTPRPTIISRTAWGAAAARACDSPRIADRELGVIVHHTAGTNSYTSTQSAGIVRGVQAYHMNGRGWCDIGYNFLVDKYGQIFEGRSGGTYAQVRGAHAGNTTVNTYATGISMMGNFDTAGVTTALASAMVRLVGWRLGTFWLPVDGGYAIAGKALARISGHRDVYNSGIRPATSTACPGRYGYAWMIGAGGLRDRVRAYIAHYSTPNRTRAAQLGTAAVGYPHFTEYASHGGLITQMTRGDLYSYAGGAAHWLPIGAKRTEYYALGQVVGFLGYPTSDVITLGSTGVNMVSFQGGAVYGWARNGVAVAYALTSRIDAVYRGVSGPAGRLGAPTGRRIVANGYESARFEHGQIIVRQATGAYSIKYDA